MRYTPAEIAAQRVRAIFILNCVAEVYNIGVNKLMWKRRFKEIVIPRHAAIYLIRNDTHMTLKSIGEIFGLVDHATIINSIQNTIDLLATDDEFRNKFKLITFKIYENETERKQFECLYATATINAPRALV